MTQSTSPPSDSLSPQGSQGETHQISRAAGLIGAATFCSRILGFIRDIILANLFGANAAADAFYIAYRIPNLLRELFAEGSMSSAFIPVFSEYHSTRSKQEAWELASAAFTTLPLSSRLSRSWASLQHLALSGSWLPVSMVTQPN